MKSALSTLVFTVLFVVYLFVEVFAAMAAYMYLSLSHTSTFGYLVGLSQKILSIFTTYFVQLYPDLANRAFATILGEKETWESGPLESIAPHQALRVGLFDGDHRSHRLGKEGVQVELRHESHYGLKSVYRTHLFLRRD